MRLLKSYILKGLTILVLLITISGCSSSPYSEIKGKFINTDDSSIYVTFDGTNKITNASGDTATFEHVKNYEYKDASGATIMFSSEYDGFSVESNGYYSTYHKE